MAVSFHRPTKIIVDLHAIQTNLQNELLHNKGKDVFVAVKANAYGHGAVPVAKAALAAGATGLCVATLDEAIELRENQIQAPILLLGIIDAQWVALAQSYELSVTVSSLQWLEAAAVLLSAQKAPLKIHLAVDTGMGRIGFQTIEEVHHALNFVTESPFMFFEGIFTHYATADQMETSYWELQTRRFETVIASLPEVPRYVHCSNSATSLWHEPLGNMVRLGIALYGLNPSGGALTLSYPLAPALSLVSEVVHVKKVSTGEGIGYGKTYTTEHEEWIGTVPIGYADGYIRKMQGFRVLVEGKSCEIVGRVCMDQLMIRLPYEVNAGTKVTLIGTDGQAEITLQEIANHIDTIHYEVICLLSERLPREYQ